MKRRDAFVEDFKVQKSGSLLQVLFVAARLGNQWALSALSSEKGPDELKVRASHTALFPHISFEGTRLTAISEAVGSSKQAVGQLIDDLEEMGLVERISDPQDGRAKLIRYSAEGRKQLVQGVEHLRSLEDELATKVGPKKIAAFHKTLTEVVAFLETKTSATR